ncbi:hypothetical protein [Lasius neglectus picorna-like virus 3]|nr:hypothetical protein [Lasius neglectus picorna-like virus 3]
MKTEPLQLCKSVYDILKDTKVGTKILTEYYNFPAFVQQDGIKDRISLCFKANNYDITNHVLTQSDLDTFVTPRIRPLGLTLSVITVCSRSLDGGKSITPIWQVYYNIAEIPSVEAVTAAITKLDLIKKNYKPQATGTQERTAIQQGENDSPDGEIKMPLNGPNIVPKGDIGRVLWHRNMYEIAHEPMETPDSPISIAVTTPAHTVIFKRELNNTTNMPPGMRAWAGMHAFTNATRRISLKFISAATLINEIVVGIAPVSKTTYTIQELQLIHWVALNPQDVTATVDLKLADVAWNDGENFEVNRYSFSTTTGTDSAPVHIPTLVMMTRVGIQNSYANPDVSIQIAITESFKDGKFLVTGTQLNSYLPTTIAGFRQSDGTTLAEFLNLEPGKPFHIACDGASVVRPSNQRAEEVLRIPFRRAMKGTIRYSPDGIYYHAFQSAGLIAPVYTTDQVVFDVGGVAVTYSTFDTVNVPIQDAYFRPSITQKQSPFNPPYYIIAQGLNHRDFLMDTNAAFNSNGLAISDLTIPTGGSSEAMYDILQNLILKSHNSSDIVISRVPIEQLDLRGGRYVNNHSGSQIYSASSGTVNRPLRMEVAVLVQSTRDGEVHRSLWVLADSLLSSSSLETLGGLDAAVNGNAVNDGYGEFLTNLEIRTDPELMSSVVDYVERDVVASLDTNFCRLSFPLITPQTLSAVLASARTGVEIDDATFVTALIRKFEYVGMDTNNTTQLILFNLSTIVNGGISIVVVFNPQYQTFFISNSPQNDADYFKVYRKLTFEDVVISQIRAVDKVSAGIPSTNTGNWLNRVTSTNNVFNGQVLVNPKFMKSSGSLKPILKNYKPQAATAAAAAGAAVSGVVTGIFTAVFGLLAQKELNEQQLQIKLQELQVQFENKAQLIDKEYGYKMDMLKETLQNNLAVQGLKSGLPSRTAGLGAEVPPSASINNADNPDGTVFESNGGTGWLPPGSAIPGSTTKYPNFVSGGVVPAQSQPKSGAKDLSSAATGSDAGTSSTPSTSGTEKKLPIKKNYMPQTFKNSDNSWQLEYRKYTPTGQQYI